MPDALHVQVQVQVQVLPARSYGRVGGSALLSVEKTHLLVGGRCIAAVVLGATSAWGWQEHCQN